MSDNPDTRHEDYNILEKGLKSKDPNEKRQARLAMERLERESRKSRELREALVEAHRYKERARIEELHIKLMEENLRGR